jgi:hypothetical protein
LAKICQKTYVQKSGKNPSSPGKNLAKIFDKNPTKTPQKFGGTKTFIYF